MVLLGSIGAVQPSVSQRSGGCISVGWIFVGWISVGWSHLIIPANVETTMLRNMELATLQKYKAFTACTG